MPSLKSPSSAADDPTPRNYCCVNCGHLIGSLYKLYSSSVLKINKCKNCGEVADSFIECESVIVIIDLLLLKQTAYRHVLYNTDFRIRWKLTVILLLLDSYILSKEDLKIGDNVDNDELDISAEQIFYFCFILTVIDKSVLFVVLRLMSLSHRSLQNEGAGRLVSANHIFNVITLGSITHFFMLPIVIWYSNSTELGVFLHETFVAAYFLVAMTQIYAIATNRSRWFAAFAVGLAAVLKWIVIKEVSRTIYIWE